MNLMRFQVANDAELCATTTQRRSIPIPGFIIHALIQIKILKSLLNWTESWEILTNIIKYTQINFKEDSFKINC